MLTALTRQVSPRLDRCELEFLTRQPIDIGTACAQHRAYEACLEQLGARVISLPSEEQFPDSVFVEDAAIVLEEIAVLTRPGVESRRGETPAIAAALADFRELRSIEAPGTLEGGDVMRIGKTLYVGQSHRTNAAGTAQLRELLRPFGYSVVGLVPRGCLHLKSACCYLGEETILANRQWLEDSSALPAFKIIDTPPGEPWGANALTIGGTLVGSSLFPKTIERLERAGFRVRALDLSEFFKAEAAVTCMSLVFNA